MLCFLSMLAIHLKIIFASLSLTYLKMSSFFKGSHDRKTKTQISLKTLYDLRKSLINDHPDFSTKITPFPMGGVSLHTFYQSLIFVIPFKNNMIIPPTVHVLSIVNKILSDTSIPFNSNHLLHF